MKFSSTCYNLRCRVFNVTHFICLERKDGGQLLLTTSQMSDCLIKEGSVLENGFATPDPFIDRWSATAQPASFYIKTEEGDKGSV